MKYNFIAIEGNIGVGKTTLSRLLAKHYDARLILEEFADNPFLAKFYENPQQYAFPVELFFMAERYKQLKELLQHKDMFQSLTIADYFFIKCLLFAKANLPDDEFHLFQRLFDITYQKLALPDIMIYLHAPVAKLQENIKKRNRSFEQNISNEYLIKIQDTYLQYIKQHPVKVLIVDASRVDFLGNPKHLQTIIEALSKDYSVGQHYISMPE